MSAMRFPVHRPDDETPLGRLADFGGQVEKSFGLTNDPEDLIIVELAREVDRQEELFQNSKGAVPAVKSQISERRASILQKVSDQMEIRAKRRDRSSFARLSANVLKVVCEVMAEQKLSKAQISQIVEQTVKLLEAGAASA